MTRILFFGRVSDAAGCSELNVELPHALASVGQVREWLAQRDEVLAGVILSPSVRAVIDRAFCSDDTATAGAVEIAFMSPLSGG